MRLTDRLEQDGSFLFRWRGVLPLVPVLLALPALPRTVAIEQAIGDGPDHLFAHGCMTVSPIGLLLRCATVGFVAAGTSGRSTRRQGARTLVISLPAFLVLRLLKKRTRLLDEPGRSQAP